MFLQVVRFQSQKLEEAFQNQQLADGATWLRPLRACVAAWVLLQLQPVLCPLDSPGPPGPGAAAQALSALPLMAAAWCYARACAGRSWLSLAACCTAWLLPLAEERSGWRGCAALPGRVAALLSLVLEPAADVGGPLPCAGGFAVLAVVVEAWLAQERRSALQYAGFSILTLAMLGSGGCHLRHSLERAQRELFLLQYRAAAKSQHFRLLLSCLLPTEIVEPYFERCMRLEGGNLLASPVAQRVSCAGVLFLAINAFDEMAVSCPAMELIEFLNKLFSALDQQCEEQGLVKIETVGEVYMVASGLFCNTVQRHSDFLDGSGSSGLTNGGSLDVPSLVNFALWSQETASDLGIELRMGLHCGPLVAGIVGDKLPRFRLFGDTVNTAARLEQNSPSACLLVSEKAAELARQDTTLQVSEHGTLPMKGLGEIRTFQVEYAEPPSPGTKSRLSPPTLARMLGRDRGDSLGSEVVTSALEISSGGSSNLQGFLATLPELDTAAAAEPPPFREGVSAQGPLSQVPRGGPPLVSPLWGHLERGLMDPACVEAEHLAGDSMRPALIAAPRTASAPCVTSPPRLPRTPARTFCSPTGWMSPGKQLPPRSRSVFAMAPPTAVQLPSVLEGDTYADDPPHDQLEELRRRAEAACCWWKLPFLGPLCFQNSCEEEHFHEAYIEGCSPSLRFACGFGATTVLLLGLLWPTWISAATSVFLAVMLLVCRYIAGVGSPPCRWLLAHALPAVIAVALAWPLHSTPHAPREALLWAVLAGIVHTGLPYGAAIAPAALAACLAAVRPASTPGLGRAAGACAAVALALVSMAQEALARRCFASERLCEDVLGRLRSVAEDLLPPSVVAEMRSLRFGSGGEPGRDCSLVVHRLEPVSVLQTDLVGFTALARAQEPEEVLRMLNDLFGLFDRIVGAHDIFKMETVGDAYICASGLPDYSQGEHRPQALLQLALDLLGAVARYRRRACVGLDLRAGLHTGRAIGGVVGMAMQRYHLFGGAMHVVEKLEATSPAGAVHLSEAARHALAAAGQLPPRYGGEALNLEPVEEDQLLTSKGERVQPRDVGGQGTFVLWPPIAGGSDDHEGAEAASAPGEVGSAGSWRRGSVGRRGAGEPA